VGGSNGQYIFPYIHGPAYEQDDLTLIKQFPFREDRLLEFRAAAYNVFNHPLPTFSGSFPTEQTLSFNNYNSINPAAASSGNDDFGHAAHKAGRRTMELSLKYSF
jgi:hypothetical protein